MSRIRETAKVIFPGENVENVNQAFKRLKDKDLYLRFIRLEETTPRKPGRKPEIYTANFEPLFTTLRTIKTEFEEEWLKNLIENLAFLNDYFPSYLVNTETFTGPEFSTKSLTWERTLFGYLFFLCMKLALSKGETVVVPKEESTLPPILQGFLKIILSLQFLEEKPLGQEEKERVRRVFDQNPEAYLKLLKIALSIGFRPLGVMGQGFLTLMGDILKQSPLKSTFERAIE